MFNDNEIGQRIALLRKERGYTQEQISILLNVTPQAVSKWGKWQRFTRHGIVAALSEGTGGIYR